MKTELSLMIEEMESVKSKDIRTLPGVKAMIILADCFYRLNIPLKYLGKVTIDVDESFWVNEEEAKRSIYLLAEHILRLKNLLEEEFGEEWEPIFADMIKNVSLVVHE